MGEGPAPAGRELDAMWDELVDDLRHATFDPRVAERLALVQSTCALRVKGHDHLECVLRFDAKPPEVEDGPAQGEVDVVIDLPPEMVPRFWDSYLPIALLRGHATYEGPVRKILAVLPVLRASRARNRDQTATEAA